MGGGRDYNYFNNLLRLDEETGELYWKHPGLKRNIWVPVGHTSRNNSHGGGYRRVLVNHRKYLVHRLVFLLYHKRWPEGTIDHINGIKTDNRPSNLRDVTTQENTAAYWRRNGNT